MQESIKDRVKKLGAIYLDPQGAILPALHLLLKERGYVDMEGAKLVSDALGVALTDVWQVATFYTMYARAPRGQYHIELCRNLSCSLMGAEHILNRISEILNIKPGEVSEDGKYSLELVECLGSCGSAPVMVVNGRYYENLDINRIEEILKDLK